jgi:hypothetical protein
VDDANLNAENIVSVDVENDAENDVNASVDVDVDVTSYDLCDGPSQLLSSLMILLLYLLTLLRCPLFPNLLFPFLLLLAYLPCLMSYQSISLPLLSHHKMERMQFVKYVNVDTDVGVDAATEDVVAVAVAVAVVVAVVANTVGGDGAS